MTRLAGLDSATHNISVLGLVRTGRRGRARGEGRTVAHVFNLTAHEDDKGVVRNDLHEPLAPGLVLAGRNSWSELISFDWEKRSGHAENRTGLTD